MAFPSASAPVVIARDTLRVLVVDDSAYMRHVISKHLSEAPGLAVVGAARNGLEALSLIETLNPDVVTLDIEMPELDGLATLRHIMAHSPRPVLMLSSRTTEGAYETMRALTWGAVDFVAKPANRANIAVVMDEVIAKVRLAAQTRLRPAAAKSTGPLRVEADNRPPTRATARPLRNRDKVVVIGASTGGPRALSEVMAHLPADLPATMLIVQHMPAGFTPALAERLNEISPLRVQEAKTGDTLEVGCALLAPGGFHMILDAQDRIALNKNPTVHGVRPSVDVTMAAVAQRFGDAAVGVVLTGMGSDGTQGAAIIRAMGGRILAEAESSSVVWGMPRSVIEAGHAHEVIALTDMAQHIVQMVRRNAR